jgi:hypothetical protein
LDHRWAQRIGREDADYLRRLQVAAADAVRAGADAGEATAAVRAVLPPRRARPDFEALDPRSSNARVALAEAGHPAFEQAQPDRDVNARHRLRRPCEKTT